MPRQQCHHEHRTDTLPLTHTPTVVWSLTFRRTVGGGVGAEEDGRMKRRWCKVPAPGPFSPIDDDPASLLQGCSHSMFLTRGPCSSHNSAPVAAIGPSITGAQLAQLAYAHFSECGSDTGIRRGNEPVDQSLAEPKRTAGVGDQGLPPWTMENLSWDGNCIDYHFRSPSHLSHSSSPSPSLLSSRRRIAIHTG